MTGPGAPVRAGQLAGAAEPARGGAASADGAGALTVPGLLAARAAAEPDRVALMVAGGGALRFGDWSRWSTAAAHQLRADGVRPGDRVGLRFAGADWIEYAVGYCAVQLAGAVAVPLPVRLPPAELRGYLAHCAAVRLLHGPDAGPVTADCPAGPLPDPPAPGPAVGPVGVTVQPTDLAQILYTSGTTGTRKGVAASHANLTHGLPARPRLRRYGHSRHLLHAFPIGTNAGQMMLVDALVAAPAVLAAPAFDPDGFCALIEAHRVGTVFLVPSMAIDLLNSGAPGRYDLTSVQLLSSSAAALPGAVAAALASAFPAATVVNAYTSTEAVPAVTTMVVDPGRPDSVGRPAADQAIMIADPAGRPLPAGAVGDVWLRHPGSPRAYYRDAAASAAVFRAGWVRMGDVGRLDADGYLYLLDRDSDLISSGGYRISTLHVEAALHEHPAVVDAAVFGVPHPVMGAMVAAAVTVRAAVTVAELRAFLRERLPRPEVPTRLLLLDTLPRNDAGKVLKRELRALLATVTPAAGAPVTGSAGGPAADGPAAGGPAGGDPAGADGPAGGGDPAGGDPMEAGATGALAALWRRVLRVRTAGAGDDFFALGGDSLAASQLGTLGTEAFGVDVPPALAFDHPVLADQAAWIAAAQAAAQAATRAAGQAAAAAPGGAAPDEVPLSALQEYFLRWMYETEPARAVSAVPVAIRITDELDLGALDAAMRVLAARYDALRTVFRRDGAGHRAVLLPDCPPQLVHLVAAGDTLARRERDAGRLAAAAVERPFDLATGPLARAVTVRLGERDHVLALAVHHLVTDGWSMGVLLRDLALAYSAIAAGRQPAARRPAPSAAQVTGWARQRWPAARAYWRQALAGAPPALLGAPRQAVPDRYTAGSVPVEIPAELAERFRAAGRQHAATAYQAALAAWARVLADWAGAPELVLMSPVPGRIRPQDEGVVGCLVQSLLLRVDLRGVPAYGDLLRRVRGVVLAGTEQQHYPYEEFSRQLPHPAWFRYERWPGEACFLGLASGPFPLPRELMFDWPMPPGEPDRSVPELALTEQPDGSLAGWLVYNRRAYDRAAIAALGAAFRTYAETELPALPAGSMGRSG